MPNNPVIESIGARQQVRVLATYADGSERDVTREAFVESGNTEVVNRRQARPARIAPPRRGGRTRPLRRRYAATTLTVMGDRTGFAWNNPPANNCIDELVAAKLQADEDAAVSAHERRRIRPPRVPRPDRPAADARQVRAFLADKRDTKVKRDELVDKLVGSDDFVEHWTNKWADLLQVNRKFLGDEGATALRNWIRGESPPTCRTTSSPTRS